MARAGRQHRRTLYRVALDSASGPDHDRTVSEPLRAITGFDRDEHGDWVAVLACGHRQHVRHAPPFQLRPWVETEAGRDAHLGAELTCPSCRMPALPAGATPYRQTADFDEQTMPDGLRKQHSLKAGTWGRIVVFEGHLLYVIDRPQPVGFVLRPDLPGIIEPEISHHVEPRGHVLFRVEFYRAAEAAPASDK
jgi:tellurite methyltransferase